MSVASPARPFRAAPISVANTLLQAGTAPQRTPASLADLISVRQFAASLGHKPAAVQTMIERGELPRASIILLGEAHWLRRSLDVWLQSAERGEEGETFLGRDGRQKVRGYSIFKPAARNGPEDKWRVVWQIGGRCSRGKNVSTDYAEAVQWALEHRRQMRQKAALQAMGEGDRRVHLHGRPIGEHLAAYRRYLLDSNRSHKHAQTYPSQVARILDAMGVRTLAGVTRAEAQKAVASLTKLPPRRRRPDASRDARSEPLSAQTRNHYLKAFAAFCAWVDEEGRAIRNPLGRGRLNGFNVKSDRKRVRRVLTTEQLRALVAAAEGGPVYIPPHQANKAMTGADRADVYRFVLATALRAGECRKVLVADLRLDGPEPGLTVRAEISKNGKPGFVPISPELAQVLAPRVTGRPDARLFPRMPQRAAEMLRVDLAAAGIPYSDERGSVFDFHALRYQAATLLVAAGVNPKVVQDRLRHSTITLTMNTYAQAQRPDQLAAAAAVPAFADLKAGAAAATSAHAAIGSTSEALQ